MGRLYIPPPSRAPRLTFGDIVEIGCISLFAGNLLFWAGLFAGHF